MGRHPHGRVVEASVHEGSAAAYCGGAGFLVANPAEVRANPLGLPIGSQVYPLRPMLKDFPRSARTMADLGVTRLELCSPIGYGQDFAVARETGRKSEDPGRSRHEGREFPLLHGRAAEEPGKEHRVGEGCRDHADDDRDPGAMGTAVTARRLDQVKKAADEYNKIAGRGGEGGIQRACTMRASRISIVDGKRTYDLLFDLLDPKLVKFQFPDVDDQRPALVGADYFVKYPGRFISMHLQDLDMNAPEPAPTKGAAGKRGGGARRWRWAGAPSIG